MKKVIFDLDGTLFEAYITVSKALLDTLEEFHIPPVDSGMITKAIGLTTEKFLQEVMPEFTELEQFKKRFRYQEWKAIEERGRLFVGIEQILHALKEQGFLIYVCSNGSMEYIEYVIKHTGIGSYMTDLISAKFVSSKGEVIKPLIEEGEFVIVVGDTGNDFRGARELEIPSIAAAYGYGSEVEYETATFRAESPEEVLDLILLSEQLHKITAKIILEEKKRIIGINGVDTSGKTIFTKHLSRYLTSIGIRNETLSIDDYHNPAKLRYHGATEIDAYYNNAFHYDQLINEVLKPLKKDGQVHTTVCCLNLDTDVYENDRRYEVDKDSVFILEGVLLFREPVLSYLDGKIYIHIGFDEVLKRAEKRDVPFYGEAFLQKYRNKYIPVQERYLNEWNPVEISDVVIDNSNYKRPFIIKI